MATEGTKKKTRVAPRLLKGFRDYLPEEMLPRQELVRKIVVVFERFGFAPLQTPALEYADILLGKLGADAERLLYRFRDHGDRDICLRYDLTVPLARVAAQYPNLPKPFKRWQIAPVWRAEKPARGRFREFMQCDADIVGASSLVCDAECVALDHAVMSALGEPEAVIRLNNRRALSAFAALLDVPPSDAERTATVFRTLDKLPAQGRERVAELLASEAGCPAARIEEALEFVCRPGNAAEKLNRLRATGPAEAVAAADELEKLLGYAHDLGVPEKNLELDLTIARGLDYYTGAVYETFLPGMEEYGSVMSGGRYDGLIGTYAGHEVPAVGISVGLDRLFSALKERGGAVSGSSPAKVLTAALETESVPEVLRLTAKLRAAGIATDEALDNPDKPKLKKQLSYASARGIPYALIVGPDERAAGKVALKNLENREQRTLSFEEASAVLKSTASANVAGDDEATGK